MADAGIGDHDLRQAELLQAGLAGRDDAVGLADIGCEQLAASRVDRVLRHPVLHLADTACHQRQLPALLVVLQGQRLANAAGSASDEDQRRPARRGG